MPDVIAHISITARSDSSHRFTLGRLTHVRSPPIDNEKNNAINNFPHTRDQAENEKRIILKNLKVGLMN